MSAQAWAFFSAISVALIGLLGTQLKSRSDLKRIASLSESTNNAANKASESATAAKANTQNVSNGFANAVLGRLDRIHAQQLKTDEALRKHLQWHLERGK